MTINGTDLYVGGIFGYPSNCIGKWTGITWEALGLGVTGGSGGVSALAIVGPNIFAGGRSIDSFGGIDNTTGIGKWDGANWSALGNGLYYGGVRVLSSNGPDLFVGGGFSIIIDGSFANGIAKWDGTRWLTLNGGLTSGGEVFSLSYNSATSVLYAGGAFSALGGISVNNIAKWNGTIWSPLGTGILGTGNDTAVHALVVNGSDLYVGGYFSTAGGVSANNIAKWGILGRSAPLPTPAPTPVPTFAVSGTISNGGSGGNTYFVGAFTTSEIDASNAFSGTYSPSYVATVEGSYGNPSSYTLNLPGAGTYWIFGFVSGEADYYGAYNGLSYATLNDCTMLGSVEITGPSNISGIDITANPGPKNAAPIFSDSTITHEVQTYSVQIAAESGASIYYTIDGTIPNSVSSNHYTGAFTIDKSRIINAIAIKGGNTNSDVATQQYDLYWWQPLGTGLSGGNVSALAVIGSDLYAGGSFSDAGGAPVNNIAKWNGISWEALGDGLNGGVLALTTDGTNLYAGGDFSTAGGVPANNIAKWDGATWEAMGTRAQTVINALTINGTDLYAEDLNDRGFSDGIGKWDCITSTCQKLGGPNSAIYSMIYDSSHSCLYVGGQYNGDFGNNISRWDSNTSTWSSVGSGINGTVRSLTTDGTNIYAGGYFTHAGEVVSVNNIAKWDGSSWSRMGNGLPHDFNPTQANVNALAYDPVHACIYAGGSFSDAVSNRLDLARWDIINSSWEALGNGDWTGVAGTTYALTYDSTNLCLYAGGQFSSTGGGVYANHIVKWGKKN